MNLLRVRNGCLAFGAALTATLALSATAVATPSKPFSLVVCALGSSERCSPSPTSSLNAPAAVPVGSTAATMTATYTNENKSGSGIRLGSVNLTPPAGFAVTSATLPASCSGCTATVAGNVVQLRGLSLSPGGAVTVSMTVNATGATGCVVPNPMPNPTNSPLCQWATEVKQSNDFSGPPGNDLTQDPGTSAPYTVLAHATFAAEPHNELLGAPITDSDYNPPPPAGTGLPVTVKIVDANGTTVMSYVGAVTLTLNVPSNPLNPPQATLTGTNPENASAGVATFADLIVSDPGVGLTLTASATDLLPTTDSNAFDVQQSAAICTLDVSCAAEATSKNFRTTDGGLDVKVVSPKGPKSELVQTIDFGTWTAATRTMECGGASAHFAYQAFTPGAARPLAATFITTELGLTQSNFNSSVNAQEVCLAQTSPFIAKDNSTNPPSLVAAPSVVLPDGTQGHAGLEPDCGSKSNQVPLPGPCVTQRSGTLNKRTSGGTLTISDSDPADRWGN